jgi:hypothetical protein
MRGPASMVGRWRVRVGLVRAAVEALGAVRKVKDCLRRRTVMETLAGCWCLTFHDVTQSGGGRAAGYLDKVDLGTIL